MTSLPAAVRAALGRLEQRLLMLLLVYGVGKLAVTGSALLLALYALDRLFEPPFEVRLTLTATALVVFAYRVWRRLLFPLRARPSGRDLAASWERSHPDLRGLMALAVEMPEAEAGASPALLAVAHEQAASAVADLDPRRAAPAGRARRSGLRGLLVLAGLTALAWIFPQEASVFTARLTGRAVAWPSDTTLVLLPPMVDGGGELPPLEEVGDQSFRLGVANGAVVSVRVRADGKVPERVLAGFDGQSRPMRPLGGGEFVLRLPPLDGRLEVVFRGGDDDDGLPRLVLEGGDAPRLRDWSVRVEPPAYTEVPAMDSELAEFRVPAGTGLSVRFRTEPPATRVELGSLDGNAEALEPPLDGWWSFQAEAVASGEIVIRTVGEDGFRNDRAGMLRWQASADHPPKLAFLWPEENWATVPGGVVPLLYEASDDFGLADLALRQGEDGVHQRIPIVDPLRVRRFETLPAPPLPADAVEGGGSTRMRFELRASDAAPPSGQPNQVRSPWIEVLTEAAFDERHGQRMIRARELVERLLGRTHELLEPEPNGPRQIARRIGRELDGLQQHLERSLLERLYTGLDPAVADLRPTLDGMLERGAPDAGDLVTTLDAAGIAPLERAGLLLDLSRAAGAARLGPADALRQAVEDGRDPAPAARELEAQLQAMLDILLTWEDFQSAVNLLRGLLDRQRTLYLRTKEASTR